MTRGQMPSGRHVCGPTSGFRDHLARDEQSELDADSGKPDPFPALLGARRDVVISRQLSPLHPATVVDDGQRCRVCIGQKPDTRRAGVERVGDDLGENGLLERAGVCVAKVLEEMLKVDSRFPHRDILSGVELALRFRAVAFPESTLPLFARHPHAITFCRPTRGFGAMHRGFPVSQLLDSLIGETQ